MRLRGVGHRGVFGHTKTPSFPGVTSITKTLQHRRRSSHHAATAHRRTHATRCHRRRAQRRPWRSHAYATTDQQVTERLPRPSKAHAAKSNRVRLERRAHSPSVYEDFLGVALTLFVPPAVVH